jgi:hypothetical protein
MTKQLLILTGPQGAGNHLWSKILSLHPEVYGWKSLLENYWEAHRFKEPFAQHWKNHDLLKTFDWSQRDLYVTSISCPLGIHESDVNPIWNPDLPGFIDSVRSLGINANVAICGRDQNILRHQQTRIRTRPTLQYLNAHLDKLDDPIFLSYELLYLYKQDYLKSLKLNIPVAWDDPRIDEILAEDPNEKYIQYVEYNELDNGNKLGITFSERPK